MPNHFLTEDIRLLADLVQRLGKKDSSYRVFGSKHHRYKLHPVVRESELREFEERYQVTLPEDYRLFLILVGNGGAGPFYGLETLEAAVKGNLCKPFPLNKATSDYPAEELEAFNSETDAPGVLEICHQGCTIYSYLVVNGESFGLIWDGMDGEFIPMFLTFGDWYRGWVEKALRTLENEPLVKKLRIGMTKQQVQDAVNADWNERPAILRPIIYFEASEISAQLVLNQDGVVIEINHSTSIVARP